MQIAIKDWSGKEVGSLELEENVFNVPVREDIMSRVVHWQLAKRRSGSHKTKGISEISGTTRKPHKQKGTGRARQGSLRSPHMRGGAVIFGPVVRDHGYSLPKKVRCLGLKSAISGRLSENTLIVLNEVNLNSSKTKDFLNHLRGLEISSALIVEGDDVNSNLLCATANIPCIDVISQKGINVYDILRHEHLILSKEAVQCLEKRLKE